MNLEYWKKIKKQNKLTIEEIAKRAELPKGSVQNIFAGYVKSPRIDTVEAIEKALGIRQEITPEERTAGASETKKISITPIEDEMLYLFREIGYKHGEDAQRALITVAEKML